MEPATYIPKTPPEPSFVQKVTRTIKKIFKTIAKSLKKFGAFLKHSWKKFLRRFTKWIDPKLEPYRAHPKTPDAKSPAPQPTNHQTEPAPHTQKTLDDTPKTRADVLEIISQAPHGVFSQRERTTIINLLELPAVKVSEIMLPASKIVYVNAEEVLGPLTLDRLYHSGLSHFPVKNAKDELIGCVHTTHFNNLDIRQSSRVSDILDPGLYFVREDYSLEQTLNAFLRTNAFFFLVTDRYGKVVGLLNFNDFMRHLFGISSKDTFDHDNDRLAVASRRE